MPLQANKQVETVVQIIGPDDNGFLACLARRLAAKLPYSEFVPGAPVQKAGVVLAYYVNHALYKGRSGLIDVGFFTHRDEDPQFLERARGMDCCVCMSRLDEEWLLDRGVQAVTHIPMAFDSYRYRPRLLLGVIGLFDRPPEGKHLVEELRKLPFVEIVTTDGKVTEDQLPALYERLDYVLIPATLDGGPMSLLEGLAMGKPVIAPENAGMLAEFGDTEQIRRYPAGDAEALVRLVTSCYEEKLERSRLVQDRTWDRWAQAHHHLFIQLLESRGRQAPKPALGFRFDMLDELEVPLGIDVAPLEAAIDQAASHLYFGRYGQARSALKEVLPRYPFAEKLLESMPAENGEFPRRLIPRPPTRPPGRTDWQSVQPGRIGNPSHDGSSKPRLGCVLAIQNRPADALERTLQTYAFQTLEPVDKVLLDYGSEPTLAASYRDLCLRYGWRYVAHVPAAPGWHLSAAYNAAVSALSDQVEVVFKSDSDILLGEEVLARAAQFGRDKLCIFSCVTTQEDTVYPPKIMGQRDLIALLKAPRPPESMWGEGIHACPRRWFQEIGGFDLAFASWGFEDSDLRLRAQWSIGFVNVTDAVLIHPGRLVGLVKYMDEKGYAACGMPDGGVVPIRRHNPVACNAFFNVFDLRRVRPIWEKWEVVAAAKHQAAYERWVQAFARRTPYEFDHFERYYSVFFALLAAGEQLLYLDAEEWRDGISTLLKDAAGEPLVLHGWYARTWETSPETRQRYCDALKYARQEAGAS